MFPYFLVFGFLAIGALRSIPIAQQPRQPVLWFAMLLLIAFIGLRFEVGTDWYGYEVIWQSARQSFERFVGQRGDIGFNATIWQLRDWGAEYWSINLVCAIMFMVGLTAFARRMPNPWLVLAVAFPYLIIVVAMSGIRQAAAFGFLFLALNSFSDRKFLAATLWILLATTFHASAVLMLGIAAMSISTNRLKSAVILAVTIVVAVFFLSSDFDTYIERYGNGVVKSGGVMFRLLMNIGPAMLFLYFRNRMALEPHQRSLWSIFSYISIALLPLAFVVPSTTAIDRFSLYFIPLQMFMLSWLPYLTAANRKNQQATIVAILLYLSSALVVFLNFSTFARAWVPYKSYIYSDTDTRMRSVR